MRVLVTGGSGVIGAGVLPYLIDAGHAVTLLTRHADRDAHEWPHAVEPFSGDVTDAASLHGAADGCDAVVHITGIVAESPPNGTFERVNVGGTRNLLDEAARAGVPSFLYVSSLGADRGSSAYHASKRAAEALVRRYPHRALILRPGNVIGPGDEVISLLLRMHRALPAVPVIGFGDHRFQPIFYADFGEAVAVALEGRETGVLEMAGGEITTPGEILGKFSALTGRNPLRVPVPESLAGTATRLAEASGLPFPIDDAKFRMLIEENVIEPPWLNALTRVFGVTPTPLDEALRYIVDAQPEQTPGEGVGRLERKRFWADIRGGPHDAASLMTLVRARCTDLMSVEFAAEPGTPQEIAEGVSLTASLPVRGHIQVRVQEVTPRGFVFATLRGHPLAGIVRFETADLDGGVRFAITTLTRAANVFDWIAMKMLGRAMQEQNWRAVVEGVIELSGGASDGVRTASDVVEGDEAKRIEQEVSELIVSHRRRDHAG